MKVVLVANTSWYIYNFRYALIKKILGLGHEVYALPPKDDYSSRLEDLGCSSVDLKLVSAGMNPVKEISTMTDLYKKLKKISPDYVLNFTPKPNMYCSFVASLLNTKVVNNISGLGTGFLKGKLLRAVVVSMYKLTQRKADTIFFQNKDDMALFSGFNIGRKASYKLLPGSGVDTDKFYYSKKVPGEVKRFLFIGRLIRDKGIFELIEATYILLEKGYKFELVLLGSIDENNPTSLSDDDLQDILKGGNIRHIPKTDNVIEVIDECDCLVLPSYREGTPRSLLEGASMGKPLIAADSVGCKEPVDHEVNGFHCKVKDPYSLSESMERFINLSPEDIKKMGINGREKMIQEYHISIVLNRYLDAIR